MTDDAGALAGDDAVTPVRARSVGRNTAVMAAGTLVSRVLGLVRNSVLLIAAIGATGVAADAYAVANRLPNMMFAVLAAGVLNTALVPQIVRAFAAGRERTVHRILTLGGFWIFVSTAALTATAAVWVLLLTPNWGSEQRWLATTFALWCIPQLFFYGLYSLLGQVLNARERFGPFMWAPVANNVVAIAGLVAYLALYGRFRHDAGTAESVVSDWGAGRVLLVAAVATLGIAVQALILIPSMRRSGYHWRWVWRGPKGELSAVRRVASWALGAVLVEQAGVLLVTRVSSTAATAAAALAHPGVPADQLQVPHDVAGQAVYDLALSMYLVPHSLVSISLMTVMFTQLSKHAAEGNLARVRDVMSEGVRLVGVFTMLASAIMVVAAPHLVRVLAPTADAESVGAIAWVLRLMAIGLVPLGASVMVKQAFFALEDGRTVFVIHIAMSAAWLAVAYGFKWWASPTWWVAGVALGLTVTNVMAVVLRLWGLRRHLPGVDARRIVVTHAKALAAAAVASVPGAALVWVAPRTWDRGGWSAVATSGVVVLAVGAVMSVAYVVAARALRVPEAQAVGRSLARRLRHVR